MSNLKKRPATPGDRGGALPNSRLRRSVRCAAALWIGLSGLLAAAPFHAQAAAVGNPSDAPAATQAAAPDASAAASATAAPHAPNIAFYDADNPPLDELQAFDAIVLDPHREFDPSAHPLAHTTYVARASAVPGETPAEFVARQIEPLWQRGYRGFELDTPAAMAAIGEIRRAHPDARVIAGGPDALQAAVPRAEALYAVVGPPLFTELAQDGVQIQEIPAAERDARVAADQAFMRQTGVPVVSIEVCGRTDRDCARKTAAQVVHTGVTPYVTSAARDIVGIGAIEVIPRKVLVVQDPRPGLPLDETSGVRDLAMPLNYLGFDVQYADANGPLPDDITPDRYAGVVAWLQSDDELQDPVRWQRWIGERIAARVPVAFLGQFGFNAAQENGEALDLRPVPGPFRGRVDVVSSDPMVGFEINPKPDPRELAGVAVGPHSRSLLRLRNDGATVDAAAITPWGGYALSPYTVVSLDGIEQERWAIQPIAFLSAALRLPVMPSPSVTTENGRRLFMTHVDGDGFASRTEFPGPDYSGEALYQQVFARYPVPTTLSVIEGEVGQAGLYPAISPRLEAIARKMFALPYVEVGTHTYSHPFEWEDVDAKTGERIDRNSGDTAFSLNIPNYTFNLDREITGSINYINSRLLPAGKKVVILQWPGNCEPPAIVVRKAYAAGVVNVNGGDTVITKSANSWTNIAPFGVDKGPGAYQVYAPNQDENVYTNDWLGPFYGFTRVLETFDLTEQPRRFKPIDVYYHMYTGTKVASMRALKQILDTVLAEPVLPIYTSEYVRKVLDWRKFAVAREGSHTWIVRGRGEVRELHWPNSDVPLIDASHDSTGVTGYAHGPDGTYIHIDGGAARFTLGAPATVSALPYIAEANGFVRDFQRTPSGLRFDFGGYYKPFVKLANASACHVTTDGARVASSRDGNALRVDVPAAAGQQVTYRPLEIDCGS